MENNAGPLEQLPIGTWPGIQFLNELMYVRCRSYVTNNSIDEPEVDIGTSAVSSGNGNVKFLEIKKQYLG